MLELLNVFEVIALETGYVDDWPKTRTFIGHHILIFRLQITYILHVILIVKVLHGYHVASKFVRLRIY